MIRILLLSGGNMVGQNILATLAGRRGGVELIATNSVASDVALFDFDRVYLTPETARMPEAFERRFSEILALERPDLVIPCRDDDVAFLAAFKERTPALSNGFLCGNPVVAEATCDKWLSWRFAVEHGLPFAPTLVTPAGAEAETFAREHGFPLLVKPRRGYASIGVYFVVNKAQLLRAAARDGFVIQPYLGDPADVEAYRRHISDTGIPLFHSLEDVKYSIEIFIARDGSTHQMATRGRQQSGITARLERHECEQSTALGEHCARAFAGAGWRGPMNIQCKRTHDGRFVIFEFNARFNGGTAARLDMGYDEVAMAVTAFAGKVLKPANTPHTIAPAVVRRLANGVPRIEDAATLERDGVWTRHGMGKK